MIARRGPRHREKGSKEVAIGLSVFAFDLLKRRRKICQPITEISNFKPMQSMTPFYTLKGGFCYTQPL